MRQHLGAIQNCRNFPTFIFLSRIMVSRLQECRARCQTGLQARDGASAAVEIVLTADVWAANLSIWCLGEGRRYCRAKWDVLFWHGGTGSLCSYLSALHSKPPASLSSLGATMKNTVQSKITFFFLNLFLTRNSFQTRRNWKQFSINVIVTQVFPFCQLRLKSQHNARD